MKKNIRILVPLDFSDSGVLALHSATLLAKLFDGHITPFHVHYPISDYENEGMLGMETEPIPPYEDFAELEETFKNQLSEMAHEHVEEQYLAPAQVGLGSPASAIVEEAADYDLIVMNSHGRSGFSRFFLGSVSDKVLRMSHIPVLIVNKEKELQKIDRLLVTTDFSENSEAALPLAEQIASITHAKIDLLHFVTFDPSHQKQPEDSVITEQKSKLQDLADNYFSDIKDQVTIEVIPSSKSSHEAIIDYAHQNPHDLIVMATVGRTGIKYLMMGSTTSNVVQHVQTPVLSINPKQKK